MNALSRKIELLIREITPDDKNGRYLRENLRRIKEFFDAIVDGDITVAVSELSFTSNQSPDPFNKYDAQLVTSNGQTIFNLANEPASPDKVKMVINGVEMTNGVHYTVSGQVVTFNPISAGFTLETVNQFGQPDQIIFTYMVT